MGGVAYADVIVNGMTTTVINESSTGGHTANNADVTGNNSEGTLILDNSKSPVSGNMTGILKATGTGNISNGVVIIRNGSLVNHSIYGTNAEKSGDAQGTQSIARNNYVLVTDSTTTGVGVMTAAQAKEAYNNRVTILDSYIGTNGGSAAAVGLVYGGESKVYLANGGKAQDNIVDFGGGIINGRVFGGHVANDQNRLLVESITKGNVLNIGRYDYLTGVMSPINPNVMKQDDTIAGSLKAGNIANFESVNFYLDRAKDYTVAVQGSEKGILQLTASEDTSMHGNISNIVINDVSGLTNSDKIVLIEKATKDTSTTGNLGGLTTTTANREDWETATAAQSIISLKTSLVQVPIKGLAELTAETRLESDGGEGNYLIAAEAGDLDAFEGYKTDGAGNFLTETRQKMHRVVLAFDKAVVKPTAASRSLLDMRLGQMSALNEAANNFLGTLDTIVPVERKPWFVFGNLNYYDKKFDGYTNMHSSGSTGHGGVGHMMDNDWGDFTVGLFGEFGHSNYSGHYRSDPSSAQPKGDVDFVGAGFFLKQLNTSGYYGEGSFRAGHMWTDYNGRIAGNKYEFSLSGEYYGTHLAFGKLIPLTTKNILNLYSKYFYTHVSQNSTSLQGTGIDVGFSAMESSRTEIGFKDSIKLDPEQTFYFGGFYEREFKNNAKGDMTVAGNNGNIDPVQCRGSSEAAEIGYVYENDILKVDVTGRKYFGAQRGGSLNLLVRYAF